MKREEAIKIINCYDIGFHDLSGEKIPADKLADAFDMAIEALKNEINCVKCEHYTERETDTGIKGVCKMDTAHSNANQHVQHVGCVDLISRSVAIKTLTDREHDILAFIEKEDMEYEEAHSYWCEISGIHNSVEILESLPSAQWGDAEMNEVKSPYMQQSPDDGADLISRQDAIATVEELNQKVNDGRDFDTICTPDVVRRLKSLPSKITEYKTFCGVPIEEAVRVMQEYKAKARNKK